MSRYSLFVLKSAGWNHFDAQWECIVDAPMSKADAMRLFERHAKEVSARLFRGADIGRLVVEKLHKFNPSALVVVNERCFVPEWRGLTGRVEYANNDANSVIVHFDTPVRSICRGGGTYTRVEVCQDSVDLLAAVEV